MAVTSQAAQRLTAVRDLSSACYRMGSMLGRIVMVNQMVDGLDTGPNSPISAMVLRQMEAVGPDFEEAYVSLLAQITFTNAIFGTVIDLDLPDVLPTPTGSEIKTMFSKFDDLSLRMPARCADLAKVLVSKLND